MQWLLIGQKQVNCRNLPDLRAANLLTKTAYIYVWVSVCSLCWANGEPMPNPLWLNAASANIALKNGQVCHLQRLLPSHEMIFIWLQ